MRIMVALRVWVTLIVVLLPWVVTVAVPLIRIASGWIVISLLVRIVTLAVVIILPLFAIRIRSSARIVVISSLVLLVVELPLLAVVVFIVTFTWWHTPEGL